MGLSLTASTAVVECRTTASDLWLKTNGGLNLHQSSVFTNPRLSFYNSENSSETPVDKKQMRNQNTKLQLACSLWLLNGSELDFSS